MPFVQVSKKTPLIVDNTKSAGVVTYFTYQSVVNIDGKGLVMRKATKDATVEELQEECRQKTVLAMTNGYVPIDGATSKDVLCCWIGVY